MRVVPFSWSRFWKTLARLLLQFWVPFGLAFFFSAGLTGLTESSQAYLITMAGALVVIHLVILAVSYKIARLEHSPPDTR